VVYGLPIIAVYIIGFLKIVSAIGLLAGIFLQSLVIPSAILLAALMIGAFGMHLKIKDPFKKSIPAMTMLTLCVAILLLAS
jgi:accessory gene regulator protein AgrB